MMTVDEAINLANTAQIPFPVDWKEQLLRGAENAIRSAAQKGKRYVTIFGKVTSANAYTSFFVTPEQFAEVSAIIKQNGFRVDEHFRIRYDGVPLEIDVYW